MQGVRVPFTEFSVNEKVFCCKEIHKIEYIDTSVHIYVLFAHIDELLNVDVDKIANACGVFTFFLSDVAYFPHFTASQICLHFVPKK